MIAVKKTTIFQCEDRYEAEKLASILSVQKDNSVYVKGVSALINNEVVVKLKDNSSHSVIMKDEANALRLYTLIKDLSQGLLSVESTDFSDSVAEITLAASGS